MCLRCKYEDSCAINKPSVTRGFSGNTPQFKGAARSNSPQTGGVHRLESVRSVSGQAPSVLQKTVEKAQDETKRVRRVAPFGVEQTFQCMHAEMELLAFPCCLEYMETDWC